MSDIYSGLFLMVMGMGTVFLFLGLLILVTEGIRRIWGQPLRPAAAPNAMSAARRVPAGPASAHEEALRTAVVTAALKHHRRRRP